MADISQTNDPLAPCERMELAPFSSGNVCLDFGRAQSPPHASPDKTVCLIGKLIVHNASKKQASFVSRSKNVKDGLGASWGRIEADSAELPPDGTASVCVRWFVPTVLFEMLDRREEVDARISFSTGIGPAAIRCRLSCPLPPRAAAYPCRSSRDTSRVLASRDTNRTTSNLSPSGGPVKR